MPARDLGLLLEAAKAAGEIAARYFQSGQQVWDKGGGQGPVSEADLEIDRMLRAKLLTARPDYGWLSEESEDDTARLSHAHVFIIDPLDGTRAFVHGHKTFAHSLAIAENGRVVTAVIYLPLRDLMYQAVAGEGAFLNGDRIAPSGRETVTGATILAASNQFSPDLWPGGVPDVTRHFRSALAYRLCRVADGRFDGMLTLRDAWEWDIAAGDLICREAGVTISDRHGAALVFNNKTPQQAGVLATSPGIHARLLAKLRPPEAFQTKPI